MGQANIALAIIDAYIDQLVYDTTTVWENTGHFSPAGRVYTTAGTTAATVVGVRGLSDAFHPHDAVDAHLQSWGERANDGIFGAVSLGTVGFAGAKGLYPQAGSRAGLYSNSGGRFVFPDGQVDPAATLLGNKFGGQASVRIQGFGNREFDFVNGRYVGQTFGGTTYSLKPKNFLSASRRAQIRETIEAAKATGRQPLFNFEGGKPHPEVLDFISRNSERRCITPKVTNIAPGPQ